MRASLIVTPSSREPSTTRHLGEARGVDSRPQLRRRMALLVLVTTLILLSFAAIRTTTINAPQPPVVPRPKIRRDTDDRNGDRIDSERRRLTVFGADDRREVSDPSLYPYSAVGVLKWNAGRICTASLIGSKYAVTAADCILRSNGEPFPSTLAEPEFIAGGKDSGGSASIAHVVKIHPQSQFWEEWKNNTYVIVELDVPLGNTLGTLLLPMATDLNQTVGSTRVQMVGFDKDAIVASKASLKFSNCTLYFPSSFQGLNYMLHHDCDTSAIGSPGAPMLVRYTSMETYIIGIHTNAVRDSSTLTEDDNTLPGYSDAVANRGVLGPFIGQHLKSLVEQDKLNSTSSSSKEGDGSVDDASTMDPPTTAPPSKTTSPSRDDQTGADSSTTLEPSETSASNAALSSNMAYTSIGLVAGAWVIILFIAVRHMRKKKPKPDELEVQENRD